MAALLHKLFSWSFQLGFWSPLKTGGQNRAQRSAACCSSPRLNFRHTHFGGHLAAGAPFPSVPFTVCAGAYSQGGDVASVGRDVGVKSAALPRQTGGLRAASPPPRHHPPPPKPLHRPLPRPSCPRLIKAGR